MRINSKILSIPPYISTSWANIASLHVENQQNLLVLVVTLANSTQIEIPGLEGSILEAVFSAHARYLEQEQIMTSPPKPLPKLPFSSSPPTDSIVTFELPVKNALGLENFGSILQHNPDHVDGPDLPPDLIAKIANLSKTMGVEDPNAIPQAEPHCNCVHCQIARAMHVGIVGNQEETSPAAAEQDEFVSDEDLRFRSWDINQTGDNLFAVSNPIDQKEQYCVYLGEPLGCTCGEKHCEHIEAVLKS